MADTPISGPMALRPKDAAKALGISTRHLWTLTHAGHIPCARVGSGKRQLVLYPVEVLRVWLASQASQPASSKTATPTN
jgi:excisionase family DNA binding protein